MNCDMFSNNYMNYDLESFYGGKVCRCCLKMNASAKYFGSDITYSQYYAINSIEIRRNDGLPYWICGHCVVQLAKFSLFRQQCHISNNILNQVALHLKDNNRIPIADWITQEKLKCIPETISPSKTNCYDMNSYSDRNYYVVFHDDVEFEDDYVKKEMTEDTLFEAETDKMLTVNDVLSDAGLPDMDNPCTDYDSEDDQPLAKRISFDLKEHTTKHKTRSSKKESKRGRPKSKKLKKLKNKLKTKIVVKEEEPDDSTEKPILHVVQRDSTMYTIVQLTREDVLREMQEGRKKLLAPYLCKPCVRGFVAEDTYRKHMRKHVKLKSSDLECEFCHQYVPTKTLLTKHMKAHLLRYKCKECGELRNYSNLLNEHYAKMHAGGINLTCHVCGKSFSRQNVLAKHVQSHTTEIVKIPCERCGKLFSNPYTLRLHILSIHTDAEPAYHCDRCPKKFRLLAHLTHHRSTHSTARDYYCIECHITFKTGQSLKRHLKQAGRHAVPEAFKYPCTECDKRFTTSRKLRDHVMWDHRKKYEHRCDICDKKFRSIDGVRLHNRTVHIKSPNDYKHLCEFCNKAFFSKQNLRRHRRTHTGEKPFSCDHCDQKFSQKSSMESHINFIHLKIKRNAGQKPLKDDDINDVVNNDYISPVNTTVVMMKGDDDIQKFQMNLLCEEDLKKKNAIRDLLQRDS